MRFVVATVVIASAIAGLALAQETQRRITYTWDQQPGIEVFARNYPRRAVHEEVEGAAVLCCTANEDRTLSCRTPLEWPAGYGFGEATLAISREFRLSEASYNEVRADPGHTIRRAVRWTLPPGPDELPATFRAAIPTACDAPVVPVN